MEEVKPAPELYPDPHNSPNLPPPPAPEADVELENYEDLDTIQEQVLPPPPAPARGQEQEQEQEDRERITHDYAKDVYGMQMFENKYKEWLNDVYTPISRGVYGEGIANISGFDLSSKTPVVRLEGAFQGTQNTNPSVSRAGARSDLLETKTPNATQDHASGGDKTPSQLHSRKKSSKKEPVAGKEVP